MSDLPDPSAPVLDQVRSPVGKVDGGCARRMPWIFSCAAGSTRFPGL